MQNLCISIIIIFSLFLTTADAEAAKKFVPKKTASGAGSSGGGGLPLSVGYRADKRALHFNFRSFSGITSADYMFSYDSGGTTQGAAGSVNAGNNPGETRELLFGTCSTSVCTYHSGLKNARLKFTFHYVNGRTATKTYRIKTYF